MNSLFWALALQILAIVLLLAEIFLPSGGLLGIAMAASLVSSLVIGFASSALEGWILLGVDLIVFPAITWWGIEKIRRSPMALPEKLENGTGGEPWAELLYQTGVAETDLRPVGRVRIGNRLVDAQAQTGFVERGTTVQVVLADGNHLIVRPQ